MEALCGAEVREVQDSVDPYRAYDRRSYLPHPLDQQLRPDQQSAPASELLPHSHLRRFSWRAFCIQTMHGCRAKQFPRNLLYPLCTNTVGS